MQFEPWALRTSMNWSLRLRTTHDGRLTTHDSHVSLVLLSALFQPYDSYERGPNGESILRIGYPKGAWSPGGGKSGGILFFAYPYKRDTITKDNPFSNQGATLEYDVKLDPNFECVKGGKLPGLAGGRSNGRGCGGGNDPAQCFSVRMMWRRQCNGELVSRRSSFSSSSSSSMVASTVPSRPLALSPLRSPPLARNDDDSTSTPRVTSKQRDSARSTGIAKKPSSTRATSATRTRA